MALSPATGERAFCSRLIEKPWIIAAQELSLMCFPQDSGVSAHLENRAKQAENEKNITHGT